MTEPFGTPTLDPEGETIDYLGQRVPISFRGQPALPTAGPVAGGGAPASVGGTGAPGPAAPASPSNAPTGPSPALQQALRALGLSQRGVDALQKILASRGDAPLTSSTATTEGGAVTGSPQEEAAGLSGLAGEQTALSAANAPTAAGAVTGSAAEEAAGLSGLAGEGAGAGAGAGLAELAPYAAYIGPAISIGMRAGGNEPAGTQAAKAAVETASAAAAPFTFGLSMLAPTVAQTLVDAGVPISTVDPIFGRAIEATYSTGEYGPKRHEAGGIAHGGLEGLGQTYEAAARSADPAQVLQALGTRQSEGRIRSTLQLPPDLAAQLGLPAGEVQWSDLTPAQFTNFLAFAQQNPEALDSIVQGSGDVPYLPARSAQGVADSAARGARQLIRILLAQQAIAQSGAPAPVATPPAEAPPPGVTTSGGPMGVDVLKPEEQQPGFAELAGAAI
jgi:hypothetical protein